MSEPFPFPVRATVDVASPSEEAAFAFEPWQRHAVLWRAAILRHRRGRARRFRRLRRVAVIVAVLLTLHGLVASGVLLFALALVFAAFVVRRAVWVLRTRRLRKPWTAESSTPAELPTHTQGWLARTRPELPPAAEPILDRIAQRLEVLAQQSEAITAPGEDSDAVRRLLAEELPELVNGYRRVPRALARTSLHGAPSAEQQLLEGLGIVDLQLTVLQERLAAQDLHVLATQLQFLRLKYRAEPAFSPAPPGESAHRSA